MTVEVKLHFATALEAAEALAKLEGGETPKRQTKKEQAAAAATDAVTAAGAPAKLAPSVEALKAAIGAHFGADKNGVKAFVTSFGIAKISDASDAVRTQMSEKLATLPKTAEADPMA